MGIEELIGIAKRRGLTAISVTDHDTTAGATRATIIGKRQNIQVIHGVEFSTQDTVSGHKAHLLCYLCDHPDRLEGLCKRISDRRRAAAEQAIRKVMRYYPITPDLVAKCAAGSTNIYKAHIMHALMDAGYADAVYGDLYNKLFASDKGAVHYDIDYPDVRDVLAAIHDAGGIAVLAHPYVYHNEDLLEELVSLGLDGVEVFHPSHTEEQTAFLQAFAKEHNLLMTGGSDFHGMYSRTPHPLGSVTVPDDCVEALFAYKAEQRKAEKADA